MKRSRAGNNKRSARWGGKAFKQKSWIKEVKPCGHKGEEDSRLWEHSVAHRVFFFIFNVIGIFFLIAWNLRLPICIRSCHHSHLKQVSSWLVRLPQAWFKEKQGRTKSRQVQLTRGQAREGAIKSRWLSGLFNSFPWVLIEKLCGGWVACFGCSVLDPPSQVVYGISICRVFAGKGALPVYPPSLGLEHRYNT